MSPIKDELITKVINNEISHRKKLKKDTTSTLKNSEGDKFTHLLNKMANQIKRKKRKKAKEIQVGNENSSAVTEDNKHVTGVRTVKSLKGEKHKRLKYYELRKDNSEKRNMIISKVSNINKATLDTLKNSEDNMEYTYLLKKQIKKMKEKKKSKILKKSQSQQNNNRIPYPSKDTVIKLVEMLQLEIKHSIRQIELLTGKPVSIGSEIWSAKRVCSAELADIRKQDDLWAAYVRGFVEGYKAAHKNSYSKSCESGQQLQYEPNLTSTEKNDSLKELNQDQPDSSAPIISEAVTTNPCFIPTTTTEPLELLVLEPDIKAYFAQITNDSSQKPNKNAAATKLAGTVSPERWREEEAATIGPRDALSENVTSAMMFGTHMLCGGAPAPAVVGDPPSAGSFECDDCGMTFAHSGHLIAHRRRAHPGHAGGVESYVCDQCGKGFMRLKSLDAHRLTHTGELPYQCHECSKAYAHYSSLRRHRRRDHCGGPQPDHRGRGVADCPPATSSRPRRLARRPIRA